MTTEELREAFLLDQLFEAGRIKLFYTHHDRLIVGGVIPVDENIVLEAPEELRASFFLERREMGIINIGGKGKIWADGHCFVLDKLSCLYLGTGTKEVVFESDSGTSPARFYLLSAPAHHNYPNAIMTANEASPVDLGDAFTSNQRTVNKYIHLEGMRSCQLVMGLTVLAQGSVWNSVPPHTHTRRTEVYLYFDLPAGQRMFHFMGEPQAIKTIVMAADEAVISPPWSVHFGCGTANYAFIWGMAGENQVYTDMDALSVADLR